jgi:hypothetical protein
MHIAVESPVSAATVATLVTSGQPMASGGSLAHLASLFSAAVCATCTLRWLHVVQPRWSGSVLGGGTPRVSLRSAAFESATYVASQLGAEASPEHKIVVLAQQRVKHDGVEM